MDEYSCVSNNVLGRMPLGILSIVTSTLFYLSKSHSGLRTAIDGVGFRYSNIILVNLLDCAACFLVVGHACRSALRHRK